MDLRALVRESSGAFTFTLVSRLPTGWSVLFIVKRISGCALFALFAASGQQSPAPARAGLLEKNTLFTVYGRGFARAPILGHLGTYKDIEAMAVDTKPWLKQIAAVNGKGVVVGIHLIYAIATPCTGKGQCLNYFGDDLVDVYIKAAAARGWVVILDTQLGRSNPAEEVQRMIAKGYLAFDNVHVAIDPEFHALPRQPNPGTPIGTVTAAQINDVQDILDRYVKSQNLKTKKILMVHQFGDPTVHDGVPNMIQDKNALKTYDNVELVINADGLGNPASKIRKYNLMTDSTVYPFIHFRGIKVFFPNKWEKRGHFDKPPLSVEEIFGIKPLPGGLKVLEKPNVVSIA